MIRIALSIATGLAHLHMEIVGTQGNIHNYIVLCFIFKYITFYKFQVNQPLHIEISNRKIF